MDWKKIKKYHKNAPSFALHREDSVQKQYDDKLKKINSNRKTIEESILEDYPDLKIRPFIVVENSFPYCFTDGTKHLIIWFNPNVENYEEILENHPVIQDYVNSDRLIYFRNEMNNCSVKGLPHYHLFVSDEEFTSALVCL
jgi:hypothetical protein